MVPTKEQLEKYAALAVHVGVNVQKGQTLVVNAPLQAVELVRLIAVKAYEAGAKHVHVEWNDEQLAHIKYKLAPVEAFQEYPMWKAQGLTEMAENGAAFLSIYSPSPDLMKDVDPDRISAATKTNASALKTYKSYIMAHKVAWSLISIATDQWAQKVFPDLPADAAVEALWNRIFEATRVNLEDPIEAWKKHNAHLAQTVELLNNKRYKQLIYEAPGTNLTVDLPEKHVWLGGAKENAKGVWFNPNMPTEEVFTMPHKDGVNGVVRSTKPLNYAGQIIDGFSLTFKDGKVVDFSAETGYDALKRLLDTDDGAGRLGEIALVPHQSPISNANLIFYNTLFDENASSHLALGQAYQVNLQGGTGMSEKELSDNGANTSLVHVDFMIGSGDMNVDGLTPDGRREPLIRNGNWAV
ncbi:MULTISPECIES: aminopeptidase [Paenibacillus]|uniref:Peptidase M29 n=1 Tax=Paenibacillus naphthalenovorans TaxID=162209 RepID=A0A0U2UTL4_9BACL|nr:MULTISPECIES: aminopeptidase [Paenibacillus]ALS25281.1 peptidase M29 [Paenibacillus naphthalenovorans]GCL73391.1 aminopeptidase [Paenibacillus naphthalenovorans]